MSRRRKRRLCLHGGDSRRCEECCLARWRLTLAYARVAKLAVRIGSYSQPCEFEALYKQCNMLARAQGRFLACVRGGGWTL